MKLVLVCIEQSSNSPPLGLAYIAGYLRKYGFNDIKIVDKEEDFVKAVVDEKPDVVGISAMSVTFKYAQEVASQIKQAMDVPLIIGGVHISVAPLTLPQIFDLGVVGEGEQTVLELVQLFEKTGKFETEKLRNIDGLVFRNERNELEMSKPRQLIENLDEIPNPAWDLLKMNEYYLKPAMLTFFERQVSIGTHVISSRGCPFRCAFCSTSMFWQRYRQHSPEYFVKQVKSLIEQYKTIKSITIMEDLFIASKVRLKGVAELMKAEGIPDKVEFSCWGKTELFTEEICVLLKEMNFKTIAFGFESGSDKILKFLKRNTASLEHHKRAIQLCKKYGFGVHGTFIVGSPDETFEDLEMTFKFIRENPIDETNIYVLAPYFGTLVWQMARERNLISEDVDWSKINLGIGIWEAAKKGVPPSPELIQRMKEELFFVEEKNKDEFLRIFYDMCRFAYLRNYSNIKFSWKYLLNPTVIKKVYRRRREVMQYVMRKVGIDQLKDQKDVSIIQ